MNYITTIVSLHPYFKPHPGKMETVLELMPMFVARTQPEVGNLFYEFTVNENEVFCREGYVGAVGVLAHLANVHDLLEELLQSATLHRLEIHGPAAELEKLTEAFSGMSPIYYNSVCSVKR